MTSQFLQTTFADGLRMPNYVNGRLLSAEDLRADQAATLARLARLGKATGHGVVEGLMVTQAGTASVQVTAGLGVVPAGHLLRLPVTVTLPLKPEGGAASVSDLGLFRDCAFAVGNGGGSSLADGAYVLTAVPTAQTEGQAPLKSTAGSALPAGCAAAWEVEGVQFKAIRLTAFGVGGAGATDKNRPNRLAHWCFGSENLRRLPPDPFRFADDYGGLASVAAVDLTDCDLPLAVFYWQGTGIAFVEPWAVRRRLIHPLPSADWRGLLAETRIADAEARFLQFQDQVSRLLAAGSVATLKAVDHFRYLPPVGYLPIRPPQFLVDHLVNQLLEQLKKTKLTGGSHFVKAGQKVSKSAKLSNSWALALGNEAHAALFNTQPLMNVLLEAQLAAGVVLQPAADAIVAQPKASVEELLREQTLAALPKAGFELLTFFGAAMPENIYLIDGESVDFYLQRSWFDEAIDLTASPRFDVYLVQEVWLRLVGAAMLQAIDTVLAGRTASVRQAAKVQLAALLPPAIPGVADVPYAMFVKQPRPKVAVPVQKPSAPPAGITGNVAVWHGFDAAGAEAKVLQSFAAQVQKDNPGLKLTLQAVPGESLNQQLAVAVSAGNAPDLVLWRDQFLAEWVQGGLVQPLTGLASVHPNTLPVAQKAMVHDKALYGIPLILETMALHLNEELLKEFGLTAPKTVDELVAVVEHFSTGHFRALLPGSLVFLYGLFVAEGGPLLDEAGQCDLKAFMAGFELVQRLVRNGALFVDYEQASQTFRGRKSPLTIDGSWALAQNEESLENNLLIAPLPPGPAGPARPLAFVHGFYLVQGSQNKAAAAQVAELLAAEEVQKALAKDANRVPVIASVPVNDPLLAVYVEAATAAHALPAFPGLFTWVGAIDKLIVDVVNGLPPDAAANEACKIIS